MHFSLHCFTGHLHLVCSRIALQSALGTLQNSVSTLLPMIQSVLPSASSGRWESIPEAMLVPASASSSEGDSSDPSSLTAAAVQPLVAHNGGSLLDPSTSGGNLIDLATPTNSTQKPPTGQSTGDSGLELESGVHSGVSSSANTAYAMLLPQLGPSFGANEREGRGTSVYDGSVLTSLRPGQAERQSVTVADLSPPSISPLNLHTHEGVSVSPPQPDNQEENSATPTATGEAQHPHHHTPNLSILSLNSTLTEPHGPALSPLSSLPPASATPDVLAPVDLSISQLDSSVTFLGLPTMLPVSQPSVAAATVNGGAVRVPWDAHSIQGGLLYIYT